MEDEMRALAINDTWDLVDPPQHRKSIWYQWVYKVKYNIDGSFNRYKARFVAKYYTQTHDIDYDETFVPVAKMMTVHVVLTVKVAKRWHLH